jgi:predicted ABC-type ATPase
MNSGSLTLYVIAGPNGIGKSTTTFDFIPAGTPIINSDEIARLTQLIGNVSANTQEWSNREALRLVNEHMNNRVSFGIETNLADNDTWKFLLGMQQQGYYLHLLFICTDSLDVLNSRIRERHMRGEHFVRPDIVRERYLNGLSLLKHYFLNPDKVQLFDNAEAMRLIAERNGEDIHYAAEQPEWVRSIVSAHFPETKKSTSTKTALDSIEAVRQHYRDMTRKEKE